MWAYRQIVSQHLLSVLVMFRSGHYVWPLTMPIYLGWSNIYENKVLFHFLFLFGRLYSIQIIDQLWRIGSTILQLSWVEIDMSTMAKHVCYILIPYMKMVMSRRMKTVLASNIIKHLLSHCWYVEICEWFRLGKLCAARSDEGRVLISSFVVCED